MSFRAKPKMEIASESEFPCVYAMSYMLTHGENIIRALHFTQDQFKRARVLEQRLRVLPMGVLVDYTLGSGEVPTGFEDIHNGLRALGLLS
jgi:hypothetical protein